MDTLQHEMDRDSKAVLTYVIAQPCRTPGATRDVSQSKAAWGCATIPNFESGERLAAIQNISKRCEGAPHSKRSTDMDTAFSR